jgi:hypothetical protein
MTREGHVRFCEGPKVKFLRPTLLIIFGERHLRHLSLKKDASIPRDVQRAGRAPTRSWANYIQYPRLEFSAGTISETRLSGLARDRARPKGGER